MPEILKSDECKATPVPKLGMDAMRPDAAD